MIWWWWAVPRVRLHDFGVGGEDDIVRLQRFDGIIEIDPRWSGIQLEDCFSGRTP